MSVIHTLTNKNDCKPKMRHCTGTQVCIFRTVHIYICLCIEKEFVATLEALQQPGANPSENPPGKDVKGCAVRNFPSAGDCWSYIHRDVSARMHIPPWLHSRIVLKYKNVEAKHSRLIDMPPRTGWSSWQTQFFFSSGTSLPVKWLNHRKEWNNGICSNMDGTRDYHTR